MWRLSPAGVIAVTSQPHFSRLYVFDLWFCLRSASMTAFIANSSTRLRFGVGLYIGLAWPVIEASSSLPE